MSHQVKALEKTRPDAVVCIGAYGPCAAFIRDARDAGFNIPICNVSFVGSENMLGLLVRTGEERGKDYTRNLINSQVVPSYENISLRAVAEYRQLMDKWNVTPPARLTGPGYEPRTYSPVSLEGFLNAKLLVEILRRLGPDPQRENIKDVVEGIQDFDLGIGVPVTFGPNKHQGLDRVFLTTVSNGRFVRITDWDRWKK
jgi:ABC-type branched-subunit amino acid transport system substrate-binding protein